MRMHYLRCVSIGAAALGLGGLSAVAGAQSTAPNQLEEIIVTAERVETSLQKTPISVTAFGAEELRQRGVTNLLEMSAFTPNLVVNTTPGNAITGGAFAIRGIGVDAGLPSVGVYVDEVYFPSGSGNILGVFDLERIEVLRGPQGTLFGRNTIAGAVQYVTAKPALGDFNGSVSAVAGNTDREDLEGVLNVPMGEITAARFGFGTQTHGGYVHDTINDVERGEDKRKFGRAQVRVQPSERLTIDLKLEEMRQEGNGRASTLTGYDNSALFVQLAGLSGAPGYTDAVLSKGQYDLRGYNFPDFFDSEYQVGQLTVEYHVTDRITFKSISASSQTKTSDSTDFDLSDLNIIGFASTTDLDVFNQEFRLTGRSMSDRLSWTTGLFYYESTSNSANAIAIGLAPPGGQQGNPTQKSDSKAVYGQVSFGFTNRLEGTLGVRYTDEQADTQGLPSSSFTDTSPHIGLNFQASDDVLLYGKASKGFRAGGTSASGGLSRQYGPENAWTYEFGTRMEFADHRVRVNPTVFLTKWEDIQFRRLEPGIGTVAVLTQNAGSANIAGLELETQFAATDRLQVIAALSYLDAKYDEVDNSVLGQVYAVPFFLGSLIVPNLCDGKDDPPVAATNPALLTPQAIALYTCTGRSEMQTSPKYKVALGLRHELPLSNGGRLSTSVDYTHTDEMRSNVTVLDFVNLPSYDLLSARIQYSAPNDRWNVAIFGTNLTDEYYLIGGSDFFTTTGASVVLDPGRPREVGVGFRVNF
jgi:iron complex outermembrane receptor protein